MIIGVLSPGVKQQGCEADHSLPSSAKVKNAWRYTFTPPYVFMVWDLVKHSNIFTFVSTKFFHIFLSKAYYHTRDH
jgi:hypothetical protein